MRRTTSPLFAEPCDAVLRNEPFTIRPNRAYGPYNVKVANLDDLIAMKQTTGRGKDIIKLAELIELRKAIRGEQG